MAKAPTFGKRQGSFGGYQLGPKSAAGESSHYTSERLGSWSHRLFHYGQLAVFAGLMLMLAALSILPQNPAGLVAMENTIHVPKALIEANDFTDPSGRWGHWHPERTSFGFNPIVSLLAVVGLFALVRGHWILGGLAALFFLFPWSWFGIESPSSIFLVIGFALVAVLRIALPERAALIILIPLVVPLVPVTFFASGAKPNLPPHFRDNVVSYKQIKFEDLVENETLHASDEDKIGRPVIRISSIGVLKAGTPEERAAKAYAWAQEKALRERPGEALVLIQRAEASGFQHDVHSERRIRIIRDYAAASGVLGESSRQKIRLQYYLGWGLASILFVAGLLLTVSGPLSNFVSTALKDRSDRIDRLRRNLGQMRPSQENGDPGPASTDGLDSIAASAGLRVAGQITARTGFYRVAFAVLASLAFIGFFEYYQYGLPAVSSNTAFDRVGITGAIDWIVEQGEVKTYRGPGPISPITYLAYLPALFLFMAGHRRLALVAILLVMSIGTIGMHPVKRHSDLEAAAFDFTSRMRAVIEDGLDGPVRVRAVNLDRPADAYRPTLRKLDAAYALAQIAYLENRPQETAAMLNHIEDPNGLHGLVHMQRFGLMKEWVAAKGILLRADQPEPRLPRPLHFQRIMGNISLLAGIVFSLLAIVVAALWGFAEHRRTRLQDLVRQRTRKTASEQLG